MIEISYRCEYIFGDVKLYATSPEGIDAFCNGFWIDANWKYTKGSDCKYWIPPHAISYIAKDHVMKRGKG
jgi:hypothetical protein